MRIVPKKPESLLKATLFAVVFAVAARAAAAEPAGTDFLVGSVRDEGGVPVAGAAVRATTAGGTADGDDRTQADGTFAIPLRGPAEALEVRCAHCRTERVPLGGRRNLAIVVRRYAALESGVPAPADLAALPYGRIVDDLALVPFAVPAASGAEISDRGLGSGRGLVLDSGAPLVDLATGASALGDFPDRFVQSLFILGPEAGFRYGNDGGGGVYDLQPNRSYRSYAAADAGGAPAVALEPSIGGVDPAYGESDDDGVLLRRGQFEAGSPFAGGMLSGGAAVASRDDSQSFFGPSARTTDLVHAGYATASRRYRTFVDLSAASVAQFDDVTQSDDYRSSYLAADVRLEHPAPVTLAIGAATTRQTAAYVIPSDLYGALLTGRADDETIYAEAETGDTRFGAHAGLGLSEVSAVETLPTARIDGERLALTPSLGGIVPLGGGTYLRAGYSQALRTPSLIETVAEPSPPPNAAPLERDELAETAIGFDDDARVRAELIAYRQFVHGFDEQRENGLGASLVWQLAPTISLRTWTLHATPQELSGSYEPFPQAEASRQVIWATYANGDGLRGDLIVHRDAHAGALLDGDLWLPLASGTALSLGTADTAGVRHWFAGIRTR